MNTITPSLVSNADDHHNIHLAMTIVKRSDIPSITSVIVDGEEHNLGIVKDFRKDPVLASFLPEIPQRTSFSWVRLLKGETLAVHSHPTSSLIIVCDGEGYCTGDISGSLEAGAIVVVPPNCLHGFCGAGNNGFWALSIQTESLGLYENIASPRVSFDSEQHKDLNHIDLLMKAHDFFMQDYQKNDFFLLLKSDEIKNNIVLERFLDHLQYFSSRFQDILRCRVANAKQEIEIKLALDHLEEEKDHDTNFAKLRGNSELKNISQELIETANWFEESMKVLSESEKIVLMHFVLEGSGQLAHAKVSKVVQDMPVSAHFALHEEEDEEHFFMGVEALKTMPDLNIEKLLTILITGWSKLNQLCTAMAKGAYT